MNIGMIFISHDLAVVADVCTHIGVMHAGSLVEYGQRHEVLDCPGHPYTRMLVNSMLTLSDEPADLSTLVCPTGTNGLSMSVGCPVHAMCQNATAACRREQADWVALSTTHRVRCPHAGEPS
jgi:oligopeptide/dipeptide ABC transporter ATP-binding protein